MIGEGARWGGSADAAALETIKSLMAGPKDGGETERGGERGEGREECSGMTEDLKEQSTSGLTSVVPVVLLALAMVLPGPQWTGWGLVP